MKNLLFIFITLITIANVSYASFPVVESNARILAIESEDKVAFINDLKEYIHRDLPVVKQPIDFVRWVKILSVLFLLFLILVLIGNAIFSGGSFM